MQPRSYCGTRHCLQEMSCDRKIACMPQLSESYIQSRGEHLKNRKVSPQLSARGFG